MVPRICRTVLAPSHISNLLAGVVVPNATNDPVSKKSELAIPLPPGPNFVRNPCVPPMIPDAVTEPENPDDHDASPLASDVSILPIHGEPPVIRTCPLTDRRAVSDVPVPIHIFPPSPYIQFPILS